MQMPDEYKDTLRRIMCNDCLHKSTVKFHILPGKCKKCRSYNTTRIEEGNDKNLVEDPDPEDLEGDEPVEDDGDAEWGEDELIEV